MFSKGEEEEDEEEEEEEGVEEGRASAPGLAHLER